MKRNFLVATFLAVALAIFTCGAQAQAARKVSIKLVGELASSAPASVGYEELDRLPLTTYVTYNPFLKEEQSYTGVLLSELVKAYGAPGVERVTVGAMDGYQVDFSRGEWERYEVMLAIRVWGEPIPVSDSGPFKVAIRYEKIEGDKRRPYNRKWIWLINELSFEVTAEGADDG